MEQSAALFDIDNSENSVVQAYAPRSGQPVLGFPPLAGRRAPGCIAGARGSPNWDGVVPGVVPISAS